MRTTIRAFTLIEMLLVLLLLSTAAAVVGIQIKGARDEEAFRSASLAFLERVRLSQELMMLGQDVRLEVAKEKGHRLKILYLNGDDQHKDILVERGNLIRGLGEVSFYNETEDQLFFDDLKLEFLSKGALMPKGWITLKKDSLEKQLYLPGFPAFLAFDRAPKEMNLNYTSEELYPHAL